jgi:hypothetical protein
MPDPGAVFGCTDCPQAGVVVRGCVVLKLETECVFADSADVVGIFPMPSITRVAGGPPVLLGGALVAGEVVPVVSVGTAQSMLLLCKIEEDLIGLVGFHDLVPGHFSVVGDCVLYQNAHVRPLVLADYRTMLLSARWTSQTWSARNNDLEPFAVALE